MRESDQNTVVVAMKTRSNASKAHGKLARKSTVIWVFCDDCAKLTCNMSHELTVSTGRTRAARTSRPCMALTL